MMPYLKPEDLRKGLIWAVSAGQTEAVELLLDSPDTAIDHPDYYDTPLFLAASGLHFNIMRTLLKRGVDPNKRSSISWRYNWGRKGCGPTPLHAVCGRSYDRYNHRYWHRSSDDEVMQKCFNLLLEAGCDINAVDEEEKTPLHYVVLSDRRSKSNDQCCRLLLENGAEVMAQDKSGNTPLHLVHLKQYNHDSTNIIDTLMANGADINKRNSKGQTPVYTMLSPRDNIDIKSLLPYVSNWNTQDADGNTPLHIIFSYSYSPASALQALLDAGADLSLKNRNGEAPIHVLREFQDHCGKEILADLLRAGADLNVVDGDGRTVLLRLLANGQVGLNNKSIKLALKYGANINVVDFDGNGPLHLACKTFRDDSLV
jgi:ankyrin repeat protein